MSGVVLIGERVADLKRLCTTLARILRQPGEVGDRVLGYADLGLERLRGRPPLHGAVGWQALLGELEARRGGVPEILEERALRKVEDATRQRLASIRDHDPFAQRWAADSVLASFCYLACRLLRPEVVLETGVAYGVSCAYILTALRENGRGVLHSVDALPVVPRAERFQGIVVDEGLRDRWSLYRGSSRRVLPELLPALGTVDLFLHDSLHTRRNMRREFDAVWPSLAPGGMMIADDVERNLAFGELRRHDPELLLAVRDRERRPLSGRAAPIIFGVAIK